MQSINIITLGCSKNLVDSERLARQAANVGYKIVFDSDDFADIVIINTCGFIGDAKQESIDMILQVANAKNNGQVKKLYVIGCLSQRYADELRNEIPEVDEYFGARGIDDILQELKVEKQNDIWHERIISTPRHTAFLKIAEGCDRSCSYCAIPLIRGPHISQPIEKIIDEAKFLVDNGVKEISLISQDLSYYGYDIYQKNQLASLISEMIKINGLEWIRLHYLYPNNFPMDVLEQMEQSPKVCHYLDMPLQHISDNVLAKMRRNFTAEKTYKLIDEIRTRIPDIALRSTLLVGHPGETQKDFEQLLEFVKQIRFDRLGVFTYSHEDGTYAEKNYKDSISEKVKQARADAIMTEQEAISLSLNQKKIGKIQKVLIDRVEGDSYIGRTQYDAYEVDDEVIINSSDLQIGEFYDVEITDVQEFDLFGHVVGLSDRKYHN